MFAIFIVACYADAIYCPDPVIPHYGYIQEGQSKTYGVKHKVFFACEPGYRLVGRRAIKCNRKGVWNRPVPTCQS